MRTAVYVRGSTSRQAQAQTIEQPLERLRAHLESQGCPLADEDIFREDGFSGSTLKRPGLDRLRDRVAADEVERVLLTAPDRLVRKYVHQVLLIEELQQHNCQVEFLEHPMSQDPNDQLLLQIRGAVAEDGSANIAPECCCLGRDRRMDTVWILIIPAIRRVFGWTQPKGPSSQKSFPSICKRASVYCKSQATYMKLGFLRPLDKNTGLPAVYQQHSWYLD